MTKLDWKTVSNMLFINSLELLISFSFKKTKNIYAHRFFMSNFIVTKKLIKYLIFNKIILFY